MATGLTVTMASAIFNSPRADPSRSPSMEVVCARFGRICQQGVSEYGRAGGCGWTCACDTYHPHDASTIGVILRRVECVVDATA